MLETHLPREQLETHPPRQQQCERGMVRWAGTVRREPPPLATCHQLPLLCMPTVGGAEPRRNERERALTTRVPSSPLPPFILSGTAHPLPCSLNPSSHPTTPTHSHPHASLTLPARPPSPSLISAHPPLADLMALLIRDEKP
eukprot:3175874-Rhodomonas_salina.1